jgi:two-component system, OmpR family, sensor histidine kinase VicK
MQLASGRWLQLHRYTTIIIQSLLCLGFIVYAFTPPVTQLYPLIDFLEVITPVSVVVALLHLIIGFFFYKPLVIKNEQLAAAILNALLVINGLLLVHATGTLLSPWLAIIALAALLSGVAGPVTASLAPTATTVYFLLSIIVLSEEAPRVLIRDYFEFISVIMMATLGYISWWYWRRHYIDKEHVELSKLSGQLKNRKQMAEVLIQSITDGIIVTDTEGKVSLMNPAAADMTEWSVEEALGIDVRNVVKFQEENEKDIQSTVDVFSQVLQSGKPIESKLQLVGRNNNIIMSSIALSPITLPESDELAGVIAVIRNISKAHAEEKRRADFISTASHEMRTPVAAIEGYLALALNEKVSKIDSNARSYLLKAHASSQHLGKLFQDLLTSAKAEDGRLVSHPTVIELSEFTEQLTDDLRFAAEKKGLLVERILGSTGANNTEAGGKTVKPLYYVMADPDRLREVITNLFDNAVKYTEKGKITIGLTGNDEVAQLFVQDTGVGIPEEDVPHMFQKFYRVDNSATRTIGGTGLGLFISRKIVELYKGRIWVESEAGKGSTFYINLPRLSSQQALAAQKQSENNQST